MPRPPRDHIEDSFHHVMMKGNHSKTMFFSSEDRSLFYNLIADGLDKYDHKIHAFCLMTNHVHLLVEIKKNTISKIIHNLSFRYSRKINQRNNRTGHFLLNRFLSKHIDDDSYYLELIRYIHRNPVRANIVSDPSLYQWSSHNTYLGNETVPWLTTKFTFSLLSKHRATAKKHYFDLVCRPDRRYSAGFDNYLFELPKLNIPHLHTAVCEFLNINAKERHNQHAQILRSKVIGLTSLSAMRFTKCNLDAIANYFECHKSTTCNNIRQVKNKHPEYILDFYASLLNKHIT